MAEERGFTVRDRRGVKDEEPAAERKQTAEAAGAGRQAAVLPPVDFSSFVLGLGQMALTWMGELPVPGTEEYSVDLAQARHSIDILDMLEAKTRGNLTKDEETLLRTLEEELKLKYVRAVERRGA